LDKHLVSGEILNNPSKTMEILEKIRLLDFYVIKRTNTVQIII